MALAVEVKNLNKNYGSRKAVVDVSFSIKPGELVCVLGPNGAGKSTTLSILSSILPASGGSAKIYGFDVQSAKSEIRKRIAVTPQELVLYEQLSAAENVIFFAQMGGILKADAQQKAKTILEKLGLGDRQDKVKNFSGGMKRRLNFAIAIALDPQVVFLDEPTVGLDPQARLLVWDYIRELKSHGKTIILTTHNMQEAEILGDRVIILDEGKIIADGSPRALIEQYGASTSAEIIIKSTIASDSGNFESKLHEYFKKAQGISNIMKINTVSLLVQFTGPFRGFLNLLTQCPLIAADEIEAINLRQATLEDAFLKLTGRRLRE